jgi:putative CocE/NonD family hydrolase
MIVIEKNVMVPMTDRVRLATDVFRLQDGPPSPVLLVRTPYGKDQMTIGGSDSFDILRAVQAGYVVIAQDVRGRYGSDGEFEPNVNETSDGVEMIAWAAAQPWSSGVVGTFGGSYLGGTQWLPARQGIYGFRPARRTGIQLRHGDLGRHPRASQRAPVHRPADRTGRP